MFGYHHRRRRRLRHARSPLRQHEVSQQKAVEIVLCIGFFIGGINYLAHEGCTTAQQYY